MVVERALDAVVITNGEHKIVVWNHQAEVIFGWPAEEALGRTMAELVVAPERLRSTDRTSIAELCRRGRSGRAA